MTISREDAVALLRKWAEERRPIAHISRIGPLRISLNGRVGFADAPANSAVIESRAGEGWDGGRVTLNLDQFAGFDYQDKREAPPETPELIVSALRLDSPEIRVCLYELAEPGEAAR